MNFVSRRLSAAASNNSIRLVAAALIGPLVWFAVAGCAGTELKWTNPFKSADDPPELADADTGFTDVSLVDRRPVSASARPRVFGVNLSILHVKVPHADAPMMENVWNHLREDLLDSDTHLHLQRNGLRIGAGHVDDWDAIKSVFDGIESSLVNQAEPIRLPEWMPLDLELDLEPTSRMIFFLDRDGVLSGANWPKSRMVFKIAHAIDRRYPDRVHLQIMPEVRQEQSGRRWVRTPIGLAQVARYNGRQFTELTFAVVLMPGQFLVLSPSGSADVPGMIGRVFLTEQLDDGQFDSYIFIRPTIQEPVPPS